MAAPRRLSTATLSGLPEAVARPAYDRAATRAGVVHLGVGAFFRAHQAVFWDDLLASDPRWAVIGASLRRPDMAEALTPQDGLYTAAVRDSAGTALRVVGSLRDVLVAPQTPDAVVAALAAPETAVITLTITEKGYGRDPATGDLDRTDPDIAADLARAAGAAPRSALGFLAEGLARRRAGGGGPVTVLSCDNLPDNGAATQAALLAFAAARDPALAEWIAQSVAFPSSMVDRIVPATTDADRETVSAALGLQDAWPVVTEPFLQWVIEDRFAGARPALETVGAEMAPDVAPYERMKLRMLNGAHSTLAYLGYLAGAETVADAMAKPEIRAVVQGLMREEAAPTVGLPAATLSAYADRLIARFDNTALRHRTWQIAMDGSQKLPQRLLGTIRDRIAAGAPYDRAALGVAAWMRYVTGVDEQGGAIDVRDPLAADLKARADGAGKDGLADALLSVRAVFGDLAEHAGFRAALQAHLARLFAGGALTAAAAVG